MSLHPEVKEEVIKVSGLYKAKNFAKLAIKSYYERPVFYLFYGALPVILILLFFSVRLPWELYIIVAGLGLVNAFKVRLKTFINSLKKKYGGRKEAS